MVFVLNDMGEAIYGHDGSYKLRVYGYKKEIDITKIISLSGIGQNDYSNQIISLGGKDNSIVSMFEAIPNMESSTVPYCHIVYYPFSLEVLYNIKKLVFFPFFVR